MTQPKKRTSPRTPLKTAPQRVHDASPEAIIEMRGIIKKFSNAAGEFTVLKGVDLMINKGEFVSIVGKSGSGKSTLLNMITGIDHPTEGQVIVNHNDIYTGVTESARSKWRGKNLGIVFQFFQLLPMLTLLENVMLPMDYVDMYDFDERPKRAMELLTSGWFGKICQQITCAGFYRSAAVGSDCARHGM
jgi:putative ABC transport system ATP-binding protein